jgi:hypothetical protein
MQPLKVLVEQNIEFLIQGRDLLQGLDEDLYRQGVPGVAVSGVGGHFRHCLDFYRCLLAGLDSGRVDYDSRIRGSRLEHDPVEALQAIEQYIQALEALLDGDTPADLALEISLDSPLEDEPLWSSSTLLRELQALLSHTVHHFALISILLRLKGRDPGPQFGIAPSTLKHEKKSLECVG